MAARLAPDSESDSDFEGFDPEIDVSNEEGRHQDILRQIEEIERDIPSEEHEEDDIPLARLRAWYHHDHDQLIA